MDFSDNPMYEPSFEFYDKNLLYDVKQGNANVHDFFRLLALCHTVMTDNKDDGKCITYYVLHVFSLTESVFLQANWNTKLNHPMKMLWFPPPETLVLSLLVGLNEASASLSMALKKSMSFYAS